MNTEKKLLHIAVMMESGTFEFDIEKQDDTQADKIIQGLADGAIEIETIQGDRVLINGARIAGVILSEVIAEAE